MLNAALFIILPTLKQLKHPSMGECVNNLQYTLRVGYHWQRSKLFIYPTTWMYARHCVERTKSGTKGNYDVIPLI